MSQSISAIVGAFALSAAMCFVGCESSSSSKAASIADMTLETRTHRGLILKHSEILSINGLIPIPDVGLVYHHALGKNPMTTLAISRDHSYRLVGYTSDSPTWEDVIGVRDRIDRIQQLTARAVAVTTAISTVRAQAAAKDEKESERDKESEERVAGLVEEMIASSGDLSDLEMLSEVVRPGENQNESTQHDEARSGSHADQGATRTAPNSAQLIAKLEAEREQLQRDIDDARRELAEFSSNHPGIVIARWSLDREGRVGGGVGDVANGSYNYMDAESGFVVFGGLRVTLLVVGDDFRQMIARLPREDAAALRYAGFTSYVLQTRHLAYTTDLTSLREFQIAAQLSAEALANPTLAAFKIDEVRIEAYMKSLSQLANSGAISGFEWERRPYCFIAGTDLPDLIDEQDGLDELKGWTTVISQIATPPSHWDVFRSLAWERMVRQARKTYHAGEIPPQKGNWVPEQWGMEDPGPSRKPCTDSRCDSFPEITNAIRQRAAECAELLGSRQ